MKHSETRRKNVRGKFPGPTWSRSLLVAALALAQPAGALAETFAVMAYNVRGLPPQVIEDRSAEIAAIAPLLEDFHTAAPPYVGIDSVVALQEVFFQGYFNVLSDPMNTDYPYFTINSTAGPSGIGDGLILFSDHPFGFFSRVPWEDCFGTLGANGSDCDTVKGFTFARVYLDGQEDVTVDVYNLHADAGQDEGSREARRANIAQLTEAIATLSPAGQAVIVLGDTNSHYTRVGDDNLQDLLSGAGLDDVWVELRRGGSVPGAGPDIEDDCLTTPDTADCELVDKVLYRSGDTVELAPQTYSVLKEMFSDEGGDLSDHYPVAVTFDYSLATTTTTSTTTTTIGSPPCGDPDGPVAPGSSTNAGSVRTPRAIVAGDALYVLKSAVGQPGFSCTLCVCDVNNDGNVTATDSLNILKKAVGQNVVLNCPAC